MQHDKLLQMVEVFGLQQFLVCSSIADEGEHRLPDLRKQETRLWNHLMKVHKTDTSFSTDTTLYKANISVAEIFECLSVIAVFYLNQSKILKTLSLNLRGLVLLQLQKMSVNLHEKEEIETCFHLMIAKDNFFFSTFLW